MRLTVVEPKPSGGMFQFSFQLAEHLAAQGHAVELLTGRDPELASTQSGFTVSPLLPTWHPGAASVESALVRKARRVARGVRHVQSLAMVTRHLWRVRPDAVLWNPPRFPIDAWMLLATRRRLPESVQALVLHETRPLRQDKRRGSPFQQRRVVVRSLAAALQAMDVIFVLGERAREDVLARWAPRGVVEVIEHGDEAVFVPEGTPVTPVDDTGPCVLFFGGWRREKGLDVLLDAFEQLSERVPGARLVVAGAVSNSVDFGRIERDARRIPGVELRPGYVPLADVPSLFSQARLVVVPYLRGNQSGVVHLAQTFARPVVATDVGDIPAAVPDGEAGLIVPPGDPDALASALQQLLENPAEARRLGQGGEDRLRTHGSWPVIASEVAATVEKAAQRRLDALGTDHHTRRRLGSRSAAFPSRSTASRGRP